MNSILRLLLNRFFQCEFLLIIICIPFHSHPVSSGGSIKYNEVIAFMHKDDSVIGAYKSILTSWNKTISLSGSHLIYARISHNDKFIPK